MKTQFTRLFGHIKINSESIAVIIMTLIAAVLYTSCTTAVDSYKTIHTSDYSLSIPNTWTVEPSVLGSLKDSPYINITSREKPIGGIDILSYDSTEPIESLLGNHVSRMLIVDKIESSEVPAMKVLLERDCQTDKQRFLQYEIHIYFIPGKLVSKYGNEIVYDFSLNSEEMDIQNNPEPKELNEQEAAEKIFEVVGIDEKQFDEIVKSFTLRNLSGTSLSN